MRSQSPYVTSQTRKIWFPFLLPQPQSRHKHFLSQKIVSSLIILLSETSSNPPKQATSLTRMRPGPKCDHLKAKTNLQGREALLVQNVKWSLPTEISAEQTSSILTFQCDRQSAADARPCALWKIISIYCRDVEEIARSYKFTEKHQEKHHLRFYHIIHNNKIKGYYSLRMLLQTKAHPQ